jgi:hypothetical protein
MNMDSAPHVYSLTATGVDGLALRIDRPEISVGSGEVLEFPVSLRADPNGLKSQSQRVVFSLRAADNPKLNVEEEARFVGPGR